MIKIYNILCYAALWGGFVSATASVRDLGQQVGAPEVRLLEKQVADHKIKEGIDALAGKIMASMPEDRREKVAFLDEMTFFDPTHPFATAWEALLRSTLCSDRLFDDVVNFLNSDDKSKAIAIEYISNQVITNLFNNPIIFHNGTKDSLSYALVFQLKDYFDKTGINSQESNHDYAKLFYSMADLVKEDFALLAKIGQYCEGSNSYEAFAKEIITDSRTMLALLQLKSDQIIEEQFNKETLKRYKFRTNSR